MHAIAPILYESRSVTSRILRRKVAIAKAAAIQPEFDFTDVDGTLVGIWAPQSSSALNIAGYNFHQCDSSPISYT
jgi:alpha-acetolactate decarboxylase